MRLSPRSFAVLSLNTMVTGGLYGALFGYLKRGRRPALSVVLRGSRCPHSRRVLHANLDAYTTGGLHIALQCHHPICACDIHFAYCCMTAVYAYFPA